MIGTNIRGIRHLWRVCNESLTPVLVNTHEYGYSVCLAVKTKPNCPFGETLALFNHHYKNGYSSIGFNTYLNSDELKPYTEKILRLGFSRAYIVTKDFFNRKDGDSTFYELTLLPKTFFEDYESFLKNNSKMINSLRDKYGFDLHDIRQQRMYIYSEGSKNFFSWAVNMFYGNKVTMNTIKTILQWNDLYGQLTKNLSKGTITAYTSRDSIDTLMTELTTLRRGKRMADAINSFNTVQKKLLKSRELSNVDKETLAKFSKLTDTKRLNFIKKMSSIEDFDELMRQMRHVCSVHFAWNKESFNDFLENVEGLNYKKIFEKDSVVLVEVFDYDTIKQLAKTTNWCISKNKSYWNNYVEHDRDNTKQYLIFDFSRKEDDKLSIVGFTTKYNKGITNAHDFVNNNLMGSVDRPTNTLLKSYISRFIARNNIYSILAADGIDINIIANYDEPLYKWDKASVINYLYECVNQENVDILMSEGDKMAISVKDENVRYFLGDTYCDNIPHEFYDKQHIIFLDFSLSKYDINKLQFAIIDGNGYDEDYCQSLYNEHSLNEGNNFDSKLIEYNLPYDIIRRTNNVKVKMRDAILSYNTPMIKECIKQCGKEGFKDVVYHYVSSDAFFNIMLATLRDYMSFDYIDIIYENGMTISEVIGTKYACDICKYMMQQIQVTNRHIGNELILPSKEDIENFYTEKIGDKNIALYIGSYLAISRIIDSEVFTNQCDYNAFIKKIVYDWYRRSGDLVDSIMLSIGKHLDFSIYDDATVYWMHYALMQGGCSTKDLAEKAAKANEKAKKSYDSIMNEIRKREEMMRSKANKKADGTSYSTVTISSTGGSNRIYYSPFIIDDNEFI